jgi:hypothetical protein
MCGADWEQRGPGRPKKLCGARECRIAYIVRWTRAKRAEQHHLKKYLEAQNDQPEDAQGAGSSGEQECVS